MQSSASTLARLERANPRQLVSQRVFGCFRIETRLAAQPIALGQIEKFAQAQIGVGGDTAPPGNDFADALRRDADLFGQPVVADAHRFQKIIMQDLARVNGRKAWSRHVGDIGKVDAVKVFNANGHGVLCSVVINDFNIVGVSALKAKANPPLVIDADAPLSGAVAGERFQPVAGRDAQVFHKPGGVDLFELVSRRIPQTAVESADSQPLEDGGGLFVGEGFNHEGTITRRMINVKRDYNSRKNPLLSARRPGRGQAKVTA
jgi:hypothetical protein